MKFYDFAEKVFALKAGGKEIAPLFIGESDAETPKEIIDAGVEALRKGKTRYGSFKGNEQLRKKIAEKHGVASENVVITPGSKFAVFAAIKVLAKPGDSACVISPHWPGYEPICEELGVKVKLVKGSLEENWQPKPEALEEAMDSKTRVVIACNPGNPTSTIIAKPVLEELAQVAGEKNAHFLLDEAYAGLAFKPLGKQIEVEGETNLVAGSFSKGFAMTGWRIGYLVAGKRVVDKVVSLAKATYSCVPEFVQDAALKALELPAIEKEMAGVYEERAKLACEILEAEFEFARPRAGFYVFARRKGLDSEKFCLKLLEKGIGVAPGSAFGYPEFLRISLTQEKEELEKSLRTIAEEAGKFV